MRYKITKKDKITDQLLSSSNFDKSSLKIALGVRKQSSVRFCECCGRLKGGY